MKAGEWPRDFKATKDNRDLVAHWCREAEVSLKGATRTQISGLIGRLIVHYPRNLSKEDFVLLLDDWCIDLKEVPLDILEEACSAYRRDPENKFFPTPGKILALAKDTLAERMRDRHALGQALAKLDNAMRGESDTSQAERDFIAAARARRDQIEATIRDQLAARKRERPAA